MKTETASFTHQWSRGSSISRDSFHARDLELRNARKILGCQRNARACASFKSVVLPSDIGVGKDKEGAAYRENSAAAWLAMPTCPGVTLAKLASNAKFAAAVDL